jgi:hypothetical protein
MWTNAERVMKRLLMACAVALVCNGARAQGIAVQEVRGDVQVRHGVTEHWITVAAGDVLKPDDSMRTGLDGHAEILADRDGVPRRIALPSEVIVDMADIRDLTPEELMLKLTMERVRSSPYKSRDDVPAPNAGVVHGGDKASGPPLPENDPAQGTMQWNGAQVLFNNGFYSTCALKGMELYRLYPETAGKYNYRLMVAESLNRAKLRGEALAEYHATLGLPGLTPAQKAKVQQAMEALQQR